MLKYILCFGIIALILIDVIIFLDLKKFIKLHEYELVENNIKGLMLRGVAMAIISLLVGVTGIIIQFI